MADERREFDVHGFDAVELRWFGDMIVTQGDGESLTVEGEPELLQKLSVRVDGGTLVLEIGQDWLERIMEGIRALGKRPLTYRIGVEKLKRLAVSGRGSVRCDRLRSDELTLAVSGQGDVRVRDLQAKDVRLRISGRGEMELEGSAESARVDITGSGEVELEDLALARADVRISGHGEAELRVSDTLDVTISGYGRVRYHGDPRLTQAIAGAGSIKRLGD